MEFIYSDRNPSARTAFVSFDAMHTVFEMILVNVEEEKARRLACDVESLLHSLQSLLDRHAAGSAFSMINAAGEGVAVGVDDELFSILQFCEAFRRGTYGYFDISALSVYAVAPPYVLDAEARTVALSSGHVMLDAGGFGKGYALDCVKELLAAEGVSDCLLNFGDSSVSGAGRHPFGDGWQVSVKDSADMFCLRDGSLSISGCMPDGKAHIVNPASRQMVSRDYMIAVEGRSAFVCEVLSTALFAAPDEMRQALMSSFDGYGYTEIRKCYSGI
ncbi:MAG: FAD:protein FMN transferase [Bacteroidales bacterium]|nr:FAD:protein FMN transferase [Bacteroidales bacterium]